MATARQPTQILQFKGAFAQNPSRGRARFGEPVPRARLAEQPPPGLPAEVAEVWAEVMAVVPLDVLGDCDQFSVEAAAHLIAQMRAGGADPGVFAQLRIALGELGMTPASRSKVKVTDFEDGAARKMGEPTGNAFADV